MFKKNYQSIAVIIPVYNVTSFLEEAIASAMNQNYPNKEIIVVDDGSLAKHEEEIKIICAKFKNVKLIRQDNHGAAHARNTGINNTSAELIVFLDGDDILRPKALSYLAKALRKNPDAVAAYAKMKTISESGKKIRQTSFFIQKFPSGKNVLYTILKGRLLFWNGSICIRKKALENLPKNNYNLSIGEDWVLWCYLALLGNIVFAGHKTVFYRRLHSNNTSYLFFSDISYINKAFNVLYNDPLFIEKIGKERFAEIKKEHTSLMNFLFATNKTRFLEKSGATKHFKEMSVPLSKLNLIKGS